MGQKAPTEASSPSVSARVAIERARDGLRADICDGLAGSVLTQRYSASIAQVVGELARAPVAAGQGAWGPLALVAIGALGRGELGPHSDLDLVLLAASAPSDPEPHFEAWMRSLLHPMWDAGIRTHVMVHDPKSWIEGAAKDLTLCTALLDVRHLAGDEGPVRELQQRARERFFGEQRVAFVQRLAQEVDDRHARFGGTVYRVEPDLKQGPGGLRDLAVVGWCVAAATGQVLTAAATDDFVHPRVVTELVRARDTLLRLRAALQLVAQRAQDRLVFQYQETMPAVLGMVGEGPVDDAVLVAAIESFMQDFYGAARDVLRYGRRACEACLPPRQRVVREERLDERFFLSERRLGHYGSDPFRDTPALAFDALALARDHGASLSGATFDCIAALAGSDAVAALATEPEAQRRFLDLLVDPNDAQRPSALELANELGLLEGIIPEFGPSRGRMQHDSYHVYTVDQHSLNAVAFLKSIARGDHRKDYPLATALHLDLEDPRILYLATLLHDVGKALGGDQCDTGARVAQEVAARLALPPGDIERCRTLVQEHITMPLLSQKRDLGDPLLVKGFAATIKTRNALRELYLLSLADMSQVKPGFLTTWKLALLDELYLATAAYLRGGEIHPAVLQARSGEPLGLPERYYVLYDVAMRRHHGRLIEQMLQERRTVLLDLDQAVGGLRLTLVGLDRPGLLAQVAAVLDEHGLTVHAADVFSVPGADSVVLDVFRILPVVAGDPAPDAAVLTRMEHELGEPVALETLRTSPPPLPGRRRAGLRRPGSTVTFDTDTSGKRSIVEVQTGDQPGVLRRITSAFAAESVAIDLARCVTEADRVADVFYVPRLNDAQQQALRGRLLDYLRER